LTSRLSAHAAIEPAASAIIPRERSLDRIVK
jgi:hypothetical protein